jgi:hypothetical protein
VARPNQSRTSPLQLVNEIAMHTPVIHTLPRKLGRRPLPSDAPGRGGEGEEPDDATTQDDARHDARPRFLWLHRPYRCIRLGGAGMERDVLCE